MVLFQEKAKDGSKAFKFNNNFLVKEYEQSYVDDIKPSNWEDPKVYQLPHIDVRRGYEIEGDWNFRFSEILKGRGKIFHSYQRSHIIFDIITIICFNKMSLLNLSYNLYMAIKVLVPIPLRIDLRVWYYNKCFD